jgi:methionyl-tRNA formyltransferase
VSFGYFLPPSLLSRLSVATINMHPSLLPRHRGPAPVVHTLLAGDTATGVSIITVSPTAFDVGAILRQDVHPVRPDDTAETLTARLAAAGADAVVDVLADLPRALERAVPQAATGATRAPKVTPAMGAVVWSPAAGGPWRVVDVWRAWRAVGRRVGVHVWVSAADGKQPARRLRLVDLTPQDVMDGAAAALPADAPPGSFHFDKASRRLALRAADGWVGLAAVQPDLKAAMGGLDWANGAMVKGLATHIRAVDPPPAGGGGGRRG